MPPFLDDDTRARLRREHRTREGAWPDDDLLAGRGRIMPSRVRRTLALLVVAAVLLLAQVAYDHSGVALWVRHAAHALGLPLAR